MSLVKCLFPDNSPAKLPFFRSMEKNILLTCFLSMLVMLSCNTGADSKDHMLNENDVSIQQTKRDKQYYKQPPLQTKIDSIVVYKQSREMAVFAGRKKKKTYIISLGQVPIGAKHSKGDNKTPEGIYYINDRNASSLYHKNLGVSYPNAKDRAYAVKHGLDTGGDIKIHGLPNHPKYKPEDYLDADWTWGCIAVSDEEIDELFTYVKPGAVLYILP